MTAPSPNRLRALRKKSGLTQTQAGALIGAKLRSWQDWESGRRNMPRAKFDLWVIRSNEVKP